MILELEISRQLSQSMLSLVLDEWSCVSATLHVPAELVAIGAHASLKTELIDRGAEVHRAVVRGPIALIEFRALPELYRELYATCEKRAGTEGKRDALIIRALP